MHTTTYAKHGVVQPEMVKCEHRGGVILTFRDWESVLPLYPANKILKNFPL